MAKVFLSATLLILISMTSSSPLTHRNAPCPESWLVFENSCYMLIVQPFTWFESQALCEANGGYLINIGSKQEENVVRHFGKTVWIGLNDVVQEGNFVWASSQQKPAHTNWKSSQPDNQGGKENCVLADFYSSHKWNDEYCMKRFAAICEKPIDQ